MRSAWSRSARRGRRPHRESKLTQAWLQSANLTRAALHKTDAVGASLVACQLMGARLTRARLPRCTNLWAVACDHPATTRAAQQKSRPLRTGSDLRILPSG